MYPTFTSDVVMLKHPFSMLLAGGRRTGKTQFIKRLLLERDRLITPRIDHVVWFYASSQADVFRELASSMNNIVFVQGLPETSVNAFLDDRDGSKLIVIDDLMAEAGERADIKHVFTRGRHENTSVVFLTQNLFHRGKHTREMSLNTDYMVLFKNPRDATIVTNLGKQMKNTAFLQEIFKQATLNPFTHLLVDMRSDTDDRLRYRANIFAEPSTVYVAGNLIGSASGMLTNIYK